VLTPTTVRADQNHSEPGSTIANPFVLMSFNELHGHL